jgi:multidrug efflux pump subunit AcrA (membrane-fusion protein)
MAIIDTPDLDAQLDAAQAQLTASEAEAKVKESEAEFAKTTYVRWQTSPKGAVSDQEREDKKARHDSSVAQLNAALPRVNLDRANVDRLRYLTRFKEVSAPYDGAILSRRAAPIPRRCSALPSSIASGFSPTSRKVLGSIWAPDRWRTSRPRSFRTGFSKAR